MAFIRLLASSITLTAYSLAVPSTYHGAGTVVRLDHAVSWPSAVSLFPFPLTRFAANQKFIGVTDGNLTSFLGVPFAKPPCVSPVASSGLKFLGT